jgi:hypothetical protein
MTSADPDSRLDMTLSGSTCWLIMLRNLSTCSLAVAINFIAMGARMRISFSSASVSLMSDIRICFSVAREPEMQEWITHRSKKEKMSYRLKQEMLDAIDRFYFNHYCESFRNGAFARANCSMYVSLVLHLADSIVRTPCKPYVEHARLVRAPCPSRAGQ